MTTPLMLPLTDEEFETVATIVSGHTRDDSFARKLVADDRLHRAELVKAQTEIARLNRPPKFGEMHYKYGCCCCAFEDEGECEPKDRGDEPIRWCSFHGEIRDSLATARAEIGRLQDAYFVDQTIAPDGELRPTISKLVKRTDEAEAENERLREVLRGIEARFSALEFVGIKLNNDAQCTLHEAHAALAPEGKEGG